LLDVAEWLNGPIVECEAHPETLFSTSRSTTTTTCYLEHANNARSMVSYDEFGTQECEYLTAHSSTSTYIIRGSMMQSNEFNELLVWSDGTKRTYPSSADLLVRGGFLDQARYLSEHIRDGQQVLPDEALFTRILHLAHKVDGSGWWNDAGEETTEQARCMSLGDFHDPAL
jgi:hypothetical protein